MGGIVPRELAARIHLSLWERSELSSGEGVVDGFEDGVGFGEDDVVPEAEDGDALLGEKRAADFVVGAGFVGVVLAAVEFDGELFGVAVEVQDVGRERMLAAEFVAGEAAVAEVAPEELFGVGGGLAEVAGEDEGVFVQRGLSVGRRGHASACFTYL
jgi:hypothetical protein